MDKPFDQMETEDLHDDAFFQQEELFTLRKRDNEVKEALMKIFQLIQSGDYNEGEIEDQVNDLYHRFYPEEFVE